MSACHKHPAMHTLLNSMRCPSRWEGDHSREQAYNHWNRWCLPDFYLEIPEETGISSFTYLKSHKSVLGLLRKPLETEEGAGRGPLPTLIFISEFIRRYSLEFLSVLSASWLGENRGGEGREVAPWPSWQVTEPIGKDPVMQKSQAGEKSLEEPFIHLMLQCKGWSRGTPEPVPLFRYDYNAIRNVIAAHIGILQLLQI